MMTEPASSRGSDTLDQNMLDHVHAATRALFGVAPLVGPIMVEIVDTILPAQRLDRLIEFVRVLESRLSRTESGLQQQFQQQVRTPEGSSLCEEVMISAARTITPRRRIALASLLERSLTQVELDYAKSIQVARLVHELGDGELLMLLYYSLPSTTNIHEGQRGELAARHPDLIIRTSMPPDTPEGSSERERRALRDSYRVRLHTLGLIEGRGLGESKITDLGKLVLRQIEVAE